MSCPYVDPLGRHRDTWWLSVDMVRTMEGYEQLLCGRCGWVFPASSLRAFNLIHPEETVERGAEWPWEA